MSSALLRGLAHQRIPGLAPPDVSTVPGDLSRRVIYADARSHLTLEHARIFAPAQRGATQLPVMRVQLSQIAGWWILPTDETGESRFTLWCDDDPAVTPGRQE